MVDQLLNVLGAGSPPSHCGPPVQGFLRNRGQISACIDFALLTCLDSRWCAAMLEASAPVLCLCTDRTALLMTIAGSPTSLKSRTAVWLPRQCSAVLDHAAWCFTADTQSGPASLAACAARRWLARNAAGVKLVAASDIVEAEACISLVSCLPALEDAALRLRGRLMPDNVLVEALAFCPRLTALSLEATGSVGDKPDERWPPLTDPPLQSCAA